MLQCGLQPCIFQFSQGSFTTDRNLLLIKPHNIGSTNIALHNSVVLDWFPAISLNYIRQNLRHISNADFSNNNYIYIYNAVGQLSLTARFLINILLFKFKFQVNLKRKRININFS